MSIMLLSFVEKHYSMIDIIGEMNEFMKLKVLCLNYLKQTLLA